MHCVYFGEKLKVRIRWESIGSTVKDLLQPGQALAHITLCSGENPGNPLQNRVKTRVTKPAY